MSFFWDLKRYNRLNYYGRIIIIIGIMMMINATSAQSTKTITPGAKIINMGIVPQTRANGLKPYGLVYDLIQTQKVPVIWSISPTKVKDSADFTVDGIKFKGGTFVVESDYAKQANVIAAINNFIAQGVSVHTTLTSVTIPVYKELKVFPRWTIDLASGSIVDDYLTNAGIPTASFPLRNPSTLSVCDDIFLLPHANPTWTTHKNLYFWNKPVSQGGNIGWIWTSCHSASELERSANTVAPFEKMNFLSLSPPNPPLVAFGSHADASAGLFSYAYPNDVPMQFMGRLDAATRNGSEQVYLPTKVGGGAWRPSTKVCVWDPNHSDIPSKTLGPAAIVVYGPAFGDTANGLVMYEAGHDHDGTAPENVAAMRAMLNFSFDAPAKKAPAFTIVNPVPTSVFSGTAYNLNISGVDFKNKPVTYAWTQSGCGGTFSSTTTAATTYTAPSASINGNDIKCSIKLTISDSCGRLNFYPISITIPAPKTKADMNVAMPGVLITGNVNTNDVVRTGTTYGTPTALAGNPSACLPTMSTNGNYTFQCGVPGEYNFRVPVCPSGVVVNCPSELLTITVYNHLSLTAAPTANPDYLRTNINTARTINVRSNDKCNNGPACTLNNPTIISQAPNGNAVVNPSGTITFTPNNNYIGRDSIMYRVCDNQTVPKCDTEYLVVNVVEQGPTYNTTIANDDYVITTENTVASGNILNNDVDPEGNTILATPQNIILSSGTFTLLNNGTYTFVPAVGFKGTAVIRTPVCDNGTPSACDTSTLYILVKPYDVTLNPDYLVTLVNVTTTGNVNTNDNVPAGGSYGAATALAGNPAACLPTINANGSYNFTCNTPGEYNFSVPYCPPFYVTGCTTQILTITVVDPRIVSFAPTANPDYMSIFQGTAGTINVRANDVCNNSPTCVLSNPTIVRQPRNGIAIVNGNGTISVTPNASFVGKDSVQYQVCDDQTIPKCDTEYLVITVLPLGTVNSTVANNDYAFTKGTTGIAGNLLLNDTDPEANTQTANTQNVVNANGTFVLAADGSYIFTAAIGVSGTLQYVYTVCDNGAPVACDTATLYILVKPIDFDTDPDFMVTLVNKNSSGNVKTNDNVPSGTTYSNVTAYPGNPSGCIPVLAANGSYTFNCAVPGEYNFSVSACPPWLVVGCPKEYLTIKVVDPAVVTTPPTANPDEIKLLQATAGTVHVKNNDGCHNGASCVLSNPTIVRQPSNGVGAVNVSGTITVTPNPSFVGEDTIIYSICDNQAPTPACDTEYVFITVYPTGSENRTVANGDYFSGKGTAPVTGNVLTNDFDAEGNTQTASAQTVNNSTGNLTINTNGTFSFVPLGGFEGATEFVYTVCDNGSPIACDTATLHILIKPGDFDTDPDFMVTTINTLTNGNLKNNDVVALGTTYGPATPIPGNPAACSPTINNDGTYTFSCTTPGEYNFQVTVCPPGVVVGCPKEYLTITVINPQNGTTPPTANPDQLTTYKGTAATVNVRSNDACNNGPGCTLTIPTIFKNPSNGALTVNGNGTITLIPFAGFVGNDTFQYIVCDNQSTPKCDTEFVFITVYQTGSANITTAVDDYGVSRHKKVVTGNVLNNDMDPEGNNQTVLPQSVTDARGTFILNANGTFTYTPSNTIKGAVEFTYSVCDDGTPVACDNATVHFMVIVPECIISNRHFVHRLK